MNLNDFSVPTNNLCNTHLDYQEKYLHSLFLLCENLRWTAFDKIIYKVCSHCALFHTCKFHFFFHLELKLIVHTLVKTERKKNDMVKQILKQNAIPPHDDNLE
jgi:hypothetical protein